MKKRRLLLKRRQRKQLQRRRLNLLTLPFCLPRMALCWRVKT
jgi:hypothetical protein